MRHSLPLPTPPWRSLFHCTARAADRRPVAHAHVDCTTVKLRLPGRRDRAETAPDTAVVSEPQLVRAGGKGRPTPKRTEAQGRRPGPPPPPPTTRKEAYRRMREQQALRRTETRAGMARGQDDSLPARDRGPVRRLVRDIVDSRRNLGSFFLPVATLVLVGYFIPNPAVQSYTVFVWFAFFLVIIADSVVLGRRIKKVVSERLGHANIGITLDVYSHVTEGLHDDAAELVAGLVFGR